MKSTSFRFSSLFFFFIVAAIAGYYNAAADGKHCQYTIKVQTGSDKDAATDSIINLTLLDASSDTVRVPNLANWGMSGPSYSYFQKGSLDTFIGTAACINACNIVVTSDGSGGKPAWYLDYVEVATIGSEESHIMFEFNQWLSTDKPPYSLSASRHQCNNKELQAGGAFDILRAWK